MLPHLPHIPVGGHLKHFLPQWHKVTSDRNILQMVQDMKLDLLDFPKQHNPPQQIKFSPKETSAAEEQIQTLLQKGTIVQVNPSQFKSGFRSNVLL